jgi:hypothetical protein
VASPFGTPVRKLIVRGLIVVWILQYRHQALHDGHITRLERVYRLLKRDHLSEYI